MPSLSLRASVPPCLRAFPLVIVRTIADRQVVLSVSSEAAAAGIKKGMTLTQARALHAGVAYAEHDPDRDARALEALGRWMMQFSPVVALPNGADDFPVKRTSPPRRGRAQRRPGSGRAPDPGRRCALPRRGDDVSQHSLLLDITGCERLFGGIENIVDQITVSLNRLGICAAVAVAPTPGAAWALAYAGKQGAIIAPEQLESALSPLPIESLRIDEEISACLRHLGLTTIGQVMHLPREVLPARFGKVLLERVDQAMGFIAEPLVPLPYRPPIEARIDFEGAVSSLEAIWAVFGKLIVRIIEQLARRGAGARRVDVELLRMYAPPVRREIFLSRPSRDPANLFNLFRCALEEREMLNAECLMLNQKRSRIQHSAFSIQHSILDDGFSGLRITVPLFERLTDEQILLLDARRHASQAELDHLIERLRVRLGNESIVQPELVPSYVPEAAWTCGTAALGCVPRQKTKYSASSNTAGGGCATSSTRPLHLLATPMELRVMVTPSEDAEGRPAAFTHEGEVRQVMHAVGPERIAGQWWDGKSKTRDYFDVADPAGRRFWIFRVPPTGKWYLHGTFE